MAEIVKLDHPDEVTLVPGATQFLSDMREEPWGAAIELVSELQGRILVVGPHPVEWLAGLARTCEVTYITRGVIDAADAALANTEITVYCGGLLGLPDDLGAFDAVVSLCDFRRVLSLEEEVVPWRSLFDRLVARLRPGGRLMVAIENPLGLHRIAATESVAWSNGPLDWNPHATWDASRPHNLGQVRQLVPDATVTTCFSTYPSPGVIQTGGVTPELGASRDAIVLADALEHYSGIDPTPVIAAAVGAGEIESFAAAWVIDTHLSEQSGVVRRDGAGRWRQVPPAEEPGSRSLLALLAEAMSSHDNAQIRRLLAGWGAWVNSDSGRGSCHVGLVLKGISGEFQSLGADGDLDDPYRSLAWLVAVGRSWGWRMPWPSTTTDPALLGLLVAAAGLEYRSPLELEQLLAEGRLAVADPSRLSAPVLRARLARAELEIATLRSRVAWTEYFYHASRVRRAVAKATAKAKGLGRRALGF